MIRIFKSKISQYFYIETVTSGQVEDFEYTRNGNLFSINRKNTKILEVNNANYSTFLDEENNSFANANEFETYLMQQLREFDTFEEYLRFVKSQDANPVLNYTSGLLASIDYTWNSNVTTLTLLYGVNDVLQTLTLSGTVETGINTVKTLNYTGSDLTSITYS